MSGTDGSEPTAATILVATDFSPDADRALARAASLAREHGARLRLVHVLAPSAVEALPPDLPWVGTLEARALDRARESLAAVHASLLAAGHAVEGEVLVGDVRAELLRSATGADLLVLGPRGEHPLRSALIGSTAERLLRRLPIPVLVVRRPAAAPYARTVVPLDFSTGAHPRAIVAAAGRWAPAARHVAVHACHVPLESSMRLAGASEADVEHVRVRARDEARRAFAQLVGDGADADWRFVAGEGDPTPLILDEIAASDAELVVIGRQGRSALAEVLLGSVTRRVLANAECDVLVVPATAE